MKHFLITRYNLGIYSRPDADEWMKHRAPYFERCVESVRKQTHEVQWFVLIDDRTPRGAVPDGPYEDLPVSSRSYRAPDVARVIRLPLYLLVKPSEPMITQRLDNDDVIQEDLCWLIHREASAVHPRKMPLVIDPKNGHQVREVRKPYKLSWTGASPFLALVEMMPKTGMPLTCYANYHHEIHKNIPVQVLRTSRPMWWQYVHDRNVVNA